MAGSKDYMPACNLALGGSVRAVGRFEGEWWWASFGGEDVWNIRGTGRGMVVVGKSQATDLTRVDVRCFLL